MGCIPMTEPHISTFGKSVPCRDESVTPVISAAADDDHPRVFPGYFFFHKPAPRKRRRFPISTDSGSPDYYKAADSGAKLPRIYGSTIKGLSNASSNRLVNDHMLQSAAYLRVKNLSLSYSFPKSLIGKAGLGGLKVYVSCENPFTVSSLPKGIDPETLGWSYPLYRTVSFGNEHQTLTPNNLTKMKKSHHISSTMRLGIVRNDLLQ